MAKRKSKTQPAKILNWRDQFKDYGLGLMLGLGGLSLCFASINGRVTDDRKLYENLTEIRAQKQKDLNFDGDLAALHAAEARFQEKRLPQPQSWQARMLRQQKQKRVASRSARRPLSASGPVLRKSPGRPHARSLRPSTVRK